MRKKLSYVVGAVLAVAGLWAIMRTTPPSSVAASAVLARSEPAPGVLALSVREPVTEAGVKALVETERGRHHLVRVFIYAPDAVPGQNAPAARYEWTVVDGLKRQF